MSTLRSHIVIEASPDALWKVVSDAPAIADWFPAIKSSTGDQTHRTVVLQDGAALEEAVVTADSSLRRFQYRVVGGDLPVEQHLGTVDVIELRPNRSLVVYSTEIEPAVLADAFEAAVSEAVSALPRQFS